VNFSQFCIPVAADDHQKLRVLLAYDNSLVREVARESLAHWLVELSLASNGVEAQGR